MSMEAEQPPGEPVSFNDLGIFKRRHRTSKWDKVIIYLKGSSLFYREKPSTDRVATRDTKDVRK